MTLERRKEKGEEKREKMEKVLLLFSFGRDAFGENQVLARNLICRKKAGFT